MTDSRRNAERDRVLAHPDDHCVVVGEAAGPARFQACRGAGDRAARAGRERRASARSKRDPLSFGRTTFHLSDRIVARPVPRVPPRRLPSRRHPTIEPEPSGGLSCTITSTDVTVGERKRT